MERFSQNNVFVECKIVYTRLLIISNEVCGYSMKEKLIKEWNYERNGKIDPNNLLNSSGKKVWWICKKGHEWLARIADRSRGTGCPYCSNKKVIIGENDLKTVNPILAEEWNFEKNEKKPEDFFPHSGKKVWWICKNGHEWQATIDSRSRGNNCIYCAGQKAIAGVNDFGTMRPELLQEWDYEKNDPIKPSQLMLNSSKKAWWKCSKGHSWHVSLNSRMSSKSGCPICSSELRTSFPEQAILYYLSKVVKAENRYDLDGYEIDVFLPELNIGIEYDGIRFHNDEKARERENRKNEFCRQKGILLFRIKETREYKEHSKYIFYLKVGKNKERIDVAIEWIFKILEHNGVKTDNITINSDADKEEIWGNYIFSDKLQNVSYVAPHLCLEWNYKRNGELKPEQVSAYTHKKVWWICSKNHEWQAAVYHRIGNQATGCPYCIGQKVMSGYNDLVTLNPRLADEWNYQKNTNVNPHEISANSTKKVWWICSKGHEWQATIHKRNQGTGCPICHGRTVLIGYNDLKSLYPYLAEEWDYQKNTITPTMVTKGSNKTVWWLCKNGHSWQGSINRRTSRNTSCPICRKMKM